MSTSSEGEHEEQSVINKTEKSHRFFKKQHLQSSIDIISILKNDIRKQYDVPSSEEPNFSYLRWTIEKYSAQVGSSMACNDWLYKIEPLSISLPMMIHRKKKIIKLISKALETDAQELILFALNCMNALCLDFNFSKLGLASYSSLLKSLVSLSQRYIFFNFQTKNVSKKESIQLLEAFLLSLVNLIRFVPQNISSADTIAKNINILLSLVLEHKEFPVKVISIALLLELLPLSTDSIFNDNNLKKDEIIVLASLILCLKILPSYPLSWMVIEPLSFVNISIPINLLISAYFLLFNWCLGRSSTSIPYLQYRLFETLSLIRDQSPSIIQLSHHLKESISSKDALIILIPFFSKVVSTERGFSIDYLSSDEKTTFIETFCYYLKFSDDEHIPKLLGQNFPQNQEIGNIILSAIPFSSCTHPIFWKNFFVSYSHRQVGTSHVLLPSFISILSNLLSDELSNFNINSTLLWSKIIADGKDHFLFQQAILSSLQKPHVLESIFNIILHYPNEARLSSLVTLLDIASIHSMIFWENFEDKFSQLDLSYVQILRLSSYFSCTVAIQIIPIIIKKLEEIFCTETSLMSIPEYTIYLLESLSRTLTHASLSINNGDLLSISNILSVCAKVKESSIRMEACRIISIITKTPLLLEVVSLQSTLSNCRQILLIYEKICYSGPICNNSIIKTVLTNQISGDPSVRSITCKTAPFNINNTSENNFISKELLLNTLIGSLLWTPFRPIQEGLLVIIRNFILSSFLPSSVWKIWESAFRQVCLFASEDGNSNSSKLHSYLVPLTLLINLITNEQVSNKILGKVPEATFIVKNLFVFCWKYSSAVSLLASLTSPLKQFLVPKSLRKPLCMPLLHLLALIPDFGREKDSSEHLLIGEILIDECLCIGDSTFQSASIDVLSNLYHNRTVLLSSSSTPTESSLSLPIMINELKALTDTGKGSGGEWRDALHRILSKTGSIYVDGNNSNSFIFARILISVLFGRLSHFSRLSSNIQATHRKMIIMAIVCYLPPTPFWNLFVKLSSISFGNKSILNQVSTTSTLHTVQTISTIENSNLQYSEPEYDHFPKGSHVVGFLNVVDEFISQAGNSLPVDLIKSLFLILFSIIERTDLDKDDNPYKKSPTFPLDLPKKRKYLVENPNFVDCMDTLTNVNDSDTFMESIDMSFTSLSDFDSLGEMEVIGEDLSIIPSVTTVATKIELERINNPQKKSSNRNISHTYCLIGKLLNLYFRKKLDIVTDPILSSSVLIRIMSYPKTKRNEDLTYALDIAISIATIDLSESPSLSSVYIQLLLPWLLNKLPFLSSATDKIAEKIVDKIVIPFLSSTKFIEINTCLRDVISKSLLECLKGKKGSLNILLKAISLLDPTAASFQEIILQLKCLLEKEACSWLKFKNKSKNFGESNLSFSTEIIYSAFSLICKEKGIEFLFQISKDSQSPQEIQIGLALMLGALSNFIKEDCQDADLILSNPIANLSPSKYTSTKIVTISSDDHYSVNDLIENFRNWLLQAPWWMKESFDLGKTISTIDPLLQKPDLLFSARSSLSVIQDNLVRIISTFDQFDEFVSNIMEPNQNLGALIILLNLIICWLQRSILKGLSCLRSDMLSFLSLLIQRIPPKLKIHLQPSFQAFNQLLSQFDSETCPLAALGDVQFAQRQKGLERIHSALIQKLSDYVLPTNQGSNTQFDKHIPQRSLSIMPKELSKLILQWIWPLAAVALIPESRKRPGFPAGTLSAYASVQEAALGLWIECSIATSNPEPKKIILMLTSAIGGHFPHNRRPSERWWPSQALSMTPRLAKRLLIAFLDVLISRLTTSKPPGPDEGSSNNIKSMPRTTLEALGQLALLKVGPLCLNSTATFSKSSVDGGSQNQEDRHRSKLAIVLIRFLAASGMSFPTSILSSLIPGLRSRDPRTRSEIREILKAIIKAWGFSVTLPEITYQVHSLIMPASAERFLYSMAKKDNGSHKSNDNSRPRFHHSQHHGGFLRHVTSYTLSFLLEASLDQLPPLQPLVTFTEDKSKLITHQLGPEDNQHIQGLDNFTISRLVHIFYEAGFGPLAREKVTEEWAQKAIEVREQRTPRSFAALVKMISVQQVVNILLQGLMTALAPTCNRILLKGDFQSSKNKPQPRIQSQMDFDAPSAKAIFHRMASALKNHPQLAKDVILKTFKPTEPDNSPVGCLLRYAHSILWQFPSSQANSVTISSSEGSNGLEKPLSYPRGPLTNILGTFGLSLLGILIDHESLHVCFPSVFPFYNDLGNEKQDDFFLIHLFGPILLSIIQEGLKKPAPTNPTTIIIDDDAVASSMRLLARLYVQWKRNSPKSEQYRQIELDGANGNSSLSLPQRLMAGAVSRALKLVIRERPEDCSSSLVSASFSLLTGALGNDLLLNDSQLAMLIASSRFTDRLLFVRMLESGPGAASVGPFLKRFYACRRPLAIPEAYDLAELLLERLLHAQSSVQVAVKDALFSFISTYPMTQARYRFWLHSLIGQLEHPWEEAKLSALSLLYSLVVGQDHKSTENLLSSEFTATIETLILKSLLLYVQNTYESIQLESNKLLLALLNPSTIPPLLQLCSTWLTSASENSTCSFIKISLVSIVKCQEAIGTSSLSKLIGQEKSQILFSALQSLNILDKNYPFSEEEFLTLKMLYHQALDSLGFYLFPKTKII